MSSYSDAKRDAGGCLDIAVKMSCLIGLMLLLLCCKSEPLEELYYNTNYKIVSIQGAENWRDGRFSGTSKCWLIQSTTDTTLHTEYNAITDSMFYNHKVGDIIHFDYIRKDRFFHVVPK